MTRTSTRLGSRPPTRRISPSSSTRRSLACRSSGRSPISSSSSVPSWASSNRPGRSAVAPVKAPRMWPNSSHSSSCSGIAAQLIAVKLRSLRGLIRWMARARTSLPVPLSPVMSTVVLWRATRLATLEQVAHRLALADHQVLDRAGAQARAQRLHLAAQPLPLLGLPDGHGHFVGAERLVEVVVRALAHGGERGVLGAVGAHHDEERRAALGAVAPQEGEPVHLGHPHVAEDRVERLRGGAAQRLLGVAFGRHLVARLLQQQRERLPEPGIVVNDQQTHR